MDDGPGWGASSSGSSTSSSSTMMDKDRLMERGRVVGVVGADQSINYAKTFGWISGQNLLDSKSQSRLSILLRSNFRINLVKKEPSRAR